MARILLLYKQSSDVLPCFVCGFLFNVRRTETFLWRCVRDWNKWRGVSLPGMDASIVFAVVALFLLFLCGFVFLSRVHPSYAEDGRINSLCLYLFMRTRWVLIKCSLSKKKHHSVRFFTTSVARHATNILAFVCTNWFFKASGRFCVKAGLQRTWRARRA